jgi:hypothetical protein
VGDFMSKDESELGLVFQESEEPGADEERSRGQRQGAVFACLDEDDARSRRRAADVRGDLSGDAIEVRLRGGRRHESPACRQSGANFIFGGVGNLPIGELGRDVAGQAWLAALIAVRKNLGG